MLWRIVCWSNTPTYTHTHESQNIWEFRPKLEISFQSRSQMSAVLTHHHLSAHNISDSDFTIPTSGNSKFDLEMRESLLISKFKPILNNL